LFDLREIPVISVEMDSDSFTIEKFRVSWLISFSFEIENRLDFEISPERE